MNVQHQEFESLLNDYVRWGGEVTHEQVMTSLRRYRDGAFELAARRRSSERRLAEYLDLLEGEIPRRDDAEPGLAAASPAATNLRNDATDPSVAAFRRTARLLDWWNGRATTVFDRIVPDVRALDEGDAIAHHGIRRQLDLLGDDLLALQLAAFERQRLVDVALEVRERRLARSVRLANSALGAGVVLVLTMLGFFLHQKAKSARALRAANESLREKIDEANRLTTTLEFNATHDQLTGLCNRHGFVVELDAMLARTDALHGIVFIDLDKFKTVNDTCGHAAGDALLQRIAALLTEQVAGRGVAARLGGDEFVMLLPDCDAGTLRGVATSACVRLSAMAFEYEGHRFPVGGSFGAVHFEARGTTESALMRTADEASYDSKARGGGCVVHRRIVADGTAPVALDTTPMRKAA